MILLYTGAPQAGAPQVNADLSLGGYPSTTPVSNNRLANLFPSISKSDVEKKRSVIRMIALKNTTGATVTGVTVYGTTAGKKVKLKIAAVAPATDTNGNPVFEQVADGTAEPFQATLDYHEGAGNAINVGTLANNAVIGIWIQREIDPAAFPEFTTQATGKELAAILEAATQEAEETVQVSVAYN